MCNSTGSSLSNRIMKIIHHKKQQRKWYLACLTYIAAFFCTATIAYALNDDHSYQPLSQHEVAVLIEQSHLDKSFHIHATNVLVDEINHIRESETARTMLQQSLTRMEKFQPLLTTELAARQMPKELLALPLVESGYLNLPQEKNAVKAAGVWQMIPETAIHLGLSVTSTRDDRLNVLLATKAALTYLEGLHQHFNNWDLAVIAYEYGEKQLDNAILLDHTRDSWALANKDHIKNLTKFITMFDAAMVIISHPDLITKPA